MPTRARNTAAPPGTLSKAQGQAPVGPLPAALGPRRAQAWAPGGTGSVPGRPRPLSPAPLAEAGPSPESRALHAQGTASAPDGPSRPGRSRPPSPTTPPPASPDPTTPNPATPPLTGPKPGIRPTATPPRPDPLYSSPTHPFAPPGPRPAKNLLMACQAAGLLSWEGRTMAAAGWHMRGDRGNAFPRWTVSRSGAARHLVTMAKTLARCSCRRDYDGSLHVTALTLADLKSHQKLHLGRPDES